MHFGRWVEPALRRAFSRPYVHVLFGARQTGKSTLLRAALPEADLWLDLADPGQRSRYLARPQTLIEECLALPVRKKPARVVVDEVQAVPQIFDAVQRLYDNYRGRFRFVLSGSSARKLRAGNANLLPGRSIIHRLFPLSLSERPAPEAGNVPPAVLPAFARVRVATPFPAAALVDRLTFGELPGIAVAAERDREPLLQGYANVYLEEELRREAFIKDWAPFVRFLRLAASESGGIVNYAAISNAAGISAPTVKSHYQLLEDMFVGFHVRAFSGSTRKHVLSTPRFVFFDLGVRHAAAGLSITRATVLANPGPIFEQWVGIELWKRLQYLGRGQLTYLRTKGGSEVDWIVEQGRTLVPLEVKWTENPTAADARHLRAFLDEQGTRVPMGYLVCRCERPQRIAPRVTAIPWWRL